VLVVVLVLDLLGFRVETRPEFRLNVSEPSRFASLLAKPEFQK
jgi:hypothetical protein